MVPRSQHRHSKFLQSCLR